MRTVSRRTTLGVAVVAAGLLLTGCSQAAPGAVPTSSGREGVTVTGTDDGFHGTFLTPAPPRPDLALRTTDGALLDLGDRPDGEVTLLFFGYTHCPDLCPTTMADLARARATLAREVRERVHVVFVTEDPARDTPELLREWLDRFDPEFTGVIGGNEEIAAVLTALYLPESSHVADPSQEVAHPHAGGEAQAGGGHGHGDYSVDHAGTVYAWGPGGQSVIYTGGTTPEQYAQDLVRLADAA